MFDFVGDAWDSTGGKVVGGLFGSNPDEAWDKSNFHATNWGENPNYNPNDFNYGGMSAEEAAARAGQQDIVSGQFRDRGDAAQRRTLEENAALLGQEGQGRGQFQDAIGMQRSIAMGNGPSQAPAVLQQGINNAQAAGASQAGGARGQAALALGQVNAQANTANTIQQSGNDAARIKAMEQLQGAGMYGSLSRDQRGMDISRIGQRNSMDQFNRQSNDQYDIQNQQLAYQRDQLAHQMRLAQQQGGQARQGMLQGSDAQKQQMNMGVNMYNTNAVSQRAGKIGGVIGGVAQMGMGAASGGGAAASGGGAGGMMKSAPTPQNGNWNLGF
jgi:hypothetical protein